MRKLELAISTFLITVFLLVCNSDLKAQIENINLHSPNIDMEQARKIIESIDKQFSEDFRNADSLAIAAHYATDGSFGKYKGADLVSIWGDMIRSARKGGTPNLIFTTNSLSTDGEFLAELGTYQMTDDNNNVKSEGKYLLVWKQENGNWKIYRDIGL